jgi:hypothetical protein
MLYTFWMIRRALSFCVSSGMVIGGLYLLLVHVLYSDVIRGLNLIVCGTLIGVGGVWLWEDFIRPKKKK